MKKDKKVMRKYRQIIKYPLRQWRVLIVIILLSILASFVSALNPWPLKILVDHALNDITLPEFLSKSISIFSENPSQLELITFAGLMSLGLFALNEIIGLILKWAWVSIGQGSVYELEADLFLHLQRLSLQYHKKQSIGDLLNRLTGDTYCVYSLTQILLISPWQQILSILVITSIAWSFNPSLTLITVLVSMIMGGISVYFAPKLRRRRRKRREAQSRIMSFVHQTLTSIPLVKAFSKEERNWERFQDFAEDAVVVTQRGAIVESLYGSLNELVTIVGLAIILYAGGNHVIIGALSVGSFLVFLDYMRSLTRRFLGLFRSFGSLKSIEANVDRVFEVFDAEEEVKDSPDAMPLEELQSTTRGFVRLENVTYGYEADRPILKNITMEAHSGQTVALVGPTGSGKSTLVSLIPRFMDPWEGQILFDGTDVRHVKLDSLRAQVSLVLQESFLLPLTIAENIAYGRPEASHEEIVEAAVAAGADKFIQGLPKGYKTVVGERGATLSGGEKQRIAIARALLKDASVLILDEPTSALDAQTEADLLDALERLMEGRTTFIIAHRLSTIRQADQIIVLEDGRIVEAGTHEELGAAGR
jgi:ATP-binding cassette subfamily B protein/subfamily B ATP-binding cassette protein MsbA